MPADLIHEYFAARHGITFGVPEEGSEQTEFDRQLADWKNLPQEIKVSAERDFIKINDMADEAGIRAILDEAEFQDGGHEKILAQWEDFPLNRRVFYTFCTARNYGTMPAYFTIRTVFLRIGGKNAKGLDI